MINLNPFYHLKWWLIEREYVFYCWECMKISKKYNKNQVICKKCYETKCHVCEIDCQEYEEHEICFAWHESCYNEMMVYAEEELL